MDQNRTNRRCALPAAMAIAFICWQSIGAAQSVTLAWDPNTETDVAGYILYYGTGSGSYQSSTNVGKITTNTVSGLQEGLTYFFAVTAYNTSGIESEPSNEITYNANYPPKISAIANQTTTEDVPTPRIPFRIWDVETLPANLTLWASSSNPDLVANTGILLEGSGTNRTICLYPTQNRSGLTTITLSVSDGRTVVPRSFVLRVTSVNDKPTISSIPNQLINKNSSTLPIPFIVADTETPASNLVLSAVSSNPTLIPPRRILFGGSGSNRTVTLIPVKNQSGKATVTIQASDGVAKGARSFVLRVTDSNNPPVLFVSGPISAQKQTLTAIPGVRIRDTDAGTNSVRLTLGASHGRIRVSTKVKGGLTATQVRFNGRASVSIVASIQAMNATFAAANGLSYVGDLNFVGSDTVTLIVNDRGFTGLGGSKTDTKMVTVNVSGNSLDVWRNLHFVSSDLSDPTKEQTIWGNHADPDHDGRNNLLEYALGLNPNGKEPNSAGIHSQIVSVQGQSFLSMTFRRRNTESLVQYLPQVSSDKIYWGSGPGVIEEINVVALDAEFDAVTVRDLTSLTPGNPRLIRLAAIIPAGSNSTEIVSNSESFVGTALLVRGGTPSAPRTNYLGLQMVKPAVYAGMVSLTTSNAFSDIQADWGQDQFNGTNGVFYVEFGSGAMADIIGTDALSKTIVLNGGLPSSALPGTTYHIRKHSSLADVFGANNEAGLLAGNDAANADNVVLYMADLQLTAKFFFSSLPGASGWRREDLTPAADTVIYPEQGISLQRRTTNDLVILLNGEAKEGPALVPVYGGINLVGTLKAVKSLKLSDLNLYTGDPATGIAAGDNGNTADNVVIINTDGSSITCFYSNSPGAEGWLDSNLNPQGSLLVLPGTAFFIERKAPGGSFYWNIPAE